MYRNICPHAEAEGRGPKPIRNKRIKIRSAAPAPREKIPPRTAILAREIISDLDTKYAMYPIESAMPVSGLLRMRKAELAPSEKAAVFKDDRRIASSISKPIGNPIDLQAAWLAKIKAA